MTLSLDSTPQSREADRHGVVCGTERVPGIRVSEQEGST